MSVVYFQFIHRLGRPHYVWVENLNSALEEVKVRIAVCVTVCIGPSVIVLCGMMMKGREKVKPGAGS